MYFRTGIFSQLCLSATAHPIISFFLVLSFFFLYGTIFGLVLNLFALRFPSLASMTMLEIMQGVLGEWGVSFKTEN